MITCNQHDYIEIACTFHMSLMLTFKNGEKILGIAKDTNYNKEREECMIISTQSGDTSIILQELASIKATKQNSHFDIVYFE